MTKIMAEHLARSAIVYVRQSTPHQVANNLESQRRQYGLVERARQLGWNDVQVIDDDLGRSGGGITRPGFEKLLAAICERRVGAVLSIEDIFRQRSIEAMKQKARRGELFLTVAVGYVKASGDRIEKDADRRVQEAIALVFRKFAEFQTIRQVLVWCR